MVNIDLISTNKDPKKDISDRLGGYFLITLTLCFQLQYRNFAFVSQLFLNYFVLPGRSAYGQKNCIHVSNRNTEKNVYSFNRLFVCRLLSMKWKPNQKKLKKGK